MFPGRQLAWWAGGDDWVLTLITSWPQANASCQKLDVLRGGQPSGQPCRHPRAYWTKLHRTLLTCLHLQAPRAWGIIFSLLDLSCQHSKKSFVTWLVQYASIKTTVNSLTGLRKSVKISFLCFLTIHNQYIFVITKAQNVQSTWFMSLKHPLSIHI